MNKNTISKGTNMSKRHIARFLLFSATLFGCSFILQAQAPPKNLDSYVESVLKEFEVPGIALAIVKDGKVVVAKGYGVRKMGEAAGVDEHTLFGIASNSKAFTATALGMLVEEGKLEWDAQVIRYLPWFRLSDPYVTRELTVRDLLVHRSGLGRYAGDLLWWPTSTFDRKEIAKRLQYVPLEASFRSAYAYDNVLYLVAGELIETVSGLTWEDFVATRIFAKVAMKDSKPRYSDAKGHGNIATTHARIDGKVRPVNPLASDNTNPAGGINTSAGDIAKWLITQLDSGRVADGTRLFSRQTSEQLWKIVTPLPIDSVPPELAPLRANFMGYALGFRVCDFRGYKLVYHTGGLTGRVSKVAMIPELKLGVAVLTNQESRPAYESIVYFVLDHFLKAPKMEWLTAFKALNGRQMMIAQMDTQTSPKRDTTSRPPRPLASYAGTYTDAWYGDVTISFENGKLAIRFDHTPLLVGDLEHWQYDTFVAKWRDRELRADALVTFSLNPDGSIDQVKMKAVSSVTDPSFDFQDLLLKPAKRAAR
jgi:CubicO group peptidase (beta-lactamase class C family)